jgi:hypothetical protein
VKRQPARPRSNVDRRSDASALQSGFARAEGAGRRAPSDTYAEEAQLVQSLNDHRHRCGGLAGAGKRESVTKWLHGWLSRPQAGPLSPLPRVRSGTQGTGSGQGAPTHSASQTWWQSEAESPEKWKAPQWEVLAANRVGWDAGLKKKAAVAEATRETSK